MAGTGGRRPFAGSALVPDSDPAPDSEAGGRLDFRGMKAL
jgi:hypothetical protein